MSWTDLAAADAVALADDGRLDGISPPLTAPEAFTLADLAAIAAELAGREVRRVTPADAEWRDAAVAPTLGRLLGRPPPTLRDVLRARLAG